jgi:hypothetical protein
MPNESDCIEIVDCGDDNVCDTKDDTVLGTGSTDGGGNFSIAVSPPLVSGHKIFPQDTCNTLPGPPVTVGSQAAAPALTPIMMALLCAALGVLGLARVRRSR